MLTRLLGNISVEEFAKVMSHSPGKAPTEEEVAQIIREVDLDGDGTINFNGTPCFLIYKHELFPRLL